MKEIDELLRHKGETAIFHVRSTLLTVTGNIDDGEDWHYEHENKELSHYRLDDLFLTSSGAIRFFRVRTAESEPSLVPFRYSFTPYLALRSRCVSITNSVRGLHIAGRGKTEFKGIEGVTFYDGYGRVQGDGEYYGESNKGTDPAKAWGFEIGNVLDRFGCTYHSEDHVIRGDLDRLTKDCVRY
jgi:hypothetical protein